MQKEDKNEFVNDFVSTYSVPGVKAALVHIYEVLVLQKGLQLHGEFYSLYNELLPGVLTPS